jgi:DNA-nicking Smr family endonuclease
MSAPRRPPRRADAPAAADRELFRAAVADARPLPPDERVARLAPPPEPIPRQSLRDEREALASTLSDQIDVDSLLETDAELSFRRPGIGTDTLRRLRRGHWALQAELDLHGLRRDEAREALGEFFREAARRGWRCVRVVHGKGLSSPGREPVLKHKVRGWLVQMDAVLAFCQARPADGGAGAVVVLLKGAARAGAAA